MRLPNNPAAIWTTSGHHIEAMNFTNTLNISPPSFLSRKTPSRVLCPKTVRNAYQTLAPWERTSPVTNTGGQEAKARQLYNVYIIPSFAVRASSNTKWDRESFSGVRQLFSHGPTNGLHILDSFWKLQCFFSRNVCRMREQLCQIDHPDGITGMPSRGSLGYVLPRVIRLTLCLPSLPGLGRCSLHQQNHHKTWPQLQPDWRRGSQGLVAAAGGVWRTIESIEIQWILLL